MWHGGRRQLLLDEESLGSEMQLCARYGTEQQLTIRRWQDKQEPLIDSCNQGLDLFEPRRIQDGRLAT
jgi:hypothetical protein